MPHPTPHPLRAASPLRIETVPIDASAARIETARILMREYAALPHVAGRWNTIDQDIAALPAPFVVSQGVLLLAWWEDQPVGCVALGALDASTGEVKRMYVRAAGLAANHGKDARRDEDAVARSPRDLAHDAGPFEVAEPRRCLSVWQSSAGRCASWRWIRCTTWSVAREASFTSTTKRVLHSTSVAMLQPCRAPISRSPSQCPGRARSPTVGGRSRMDTAPGIVPRRSVGVRRRPR